MLLDLSMGDTTSTTPFASDNLPDRGFLRRKCPPVSSRGTMTEQGYQSENADWLDDLTETDLEGRRIGRDPMALALDVLSASGHPPRRTAALVGAMGDVPLAEGLVRHTDLRSHCQECAESLADVRECAVIDCPFWAYRMGKNPHNPRRGKNPFRQEAENVA